MPRVGSLVALVAVAAAVAGCGSGGPSSDESAIRSVLTRVDAARRAGDAEGACSSLIAVVEPEGERGDDHGDAGAEAARGECEIAFRRTLALARRDLRSYRERLEAVEVKGHEAEARARIRAVRSDGSVLVRTVSYRFVDRDGWKLAIDRGG